MTISLIDITGRKFGKLVVLGRSESDYTRPNGTKTPLWECKCGCGNIVFVRGDNLKNGNTQSCGNCPHLTYTLIDNTYYVVTDKCGRTFTIDKVDYNLVSQYTWSFDSCGYLITFIAADKCVKLHRLIMGVNDNSYVVDHIDHDPTNNRRENLRVCNRSQNNANRSLDRRNKSGTTGVNWNNKYNCWMAQIGWNKKKYKLGLYPNIEDAIEARKSAENKYFGEFSYDSSMSIAKENEVNENEVEKL